MSVNASEQLAPPPGRPGVSQYAYANGLWRALAGSDLGDGSAALLVTLTNPGSASSGGTASASGPVDVTDRPGRLLGHVTVDTAPPPPHLSSSTDSVNVGNFPATQPISGHVTVDSAPAPPHLAAGTDSVTATVANPPTGYALDVSLQQLITELAAQLNVRDAFTGSEFLADQTGAAAVITFSFSASVDLVWVLSQGGTSRVTGPGQTPTAALGAPCLDSCPQPVTVRGTTVKVYAPAGVTVSVWGYR